ncbi:MAG: hypothetical protein FJY82_11475 [Candidatus Aminicenantes bacterium]|nr:hypothetical protein [Candidatus Aminicenantes bacterium]
MDAFVTAEAWASLEALGRLSPRGKPLGYLIGHTRGKRFFVERIFTVPGRSWPSLEDHYVIDRMFAGRVIGFFAFRPDRRTAGALSAPHAAGKAFLSLHSARRPGKIKAAVFVVDFDGRFRFVRLPFRKEPRAGRAASPRS